ncbi:MAG: ankyrin repeat domain-containing protein [Paracoccaceae bacterium]|nr:ankyrin repeat domain-containing protein [Paracoccaceae bacterium]
MRFHNSSKSLSLIFSPIFVFTIAFFALLAQEAQSDYEKGQEAWESYRFSEAVLEWQQSANQGDGMSMLALGRAYAQGLGVLRNKIEAHKWFNLAASRGVFEALEEREKLEENMTDSELAEANDIAKQWQPKQVKKNTSIPSSSDLVTSRELVREAQTLLLQLGYNPGVADGLWGPKTGAAYRLFLEDRKLPIVDVLTESNLSEMRNAARTLPASNQKDSTMTVLELYQAASNGRSDRIDNALRERTDINQQDRRGWSALFYAADLGDVQATRLLIEKGADPSIQAPDGNTARSIAQSRGHHNIVDILSAAQTARQPDTVPVEDVFIQLLSILAGEGLVSANQDEEKQFHDLLNRKPSINAVDENGWTDLHWAAAMDLPGIALRLVNAGANVDETTKTDEKLFTRKLRARLNRAKTGFSWNAWRRYGDTPLHIAALTNSRKTADVLIDDGAFVNADNTQGETPLHYAIWGKSMEISRILISNGAYVNVRNSFGTTPLHYAAHQNLPDVIKLLASHRVRINARNQTGLTALHFAVSTDSSEAARALVELGADIYIQNRRGLSPVDLARNSNNNEMLEILGVN